MSYDIESNGSFWTLRVGTNKIGRKGASEALDIAVDHPTVSSNHGAFQVDQQGGIAQLEDAQSANGTFINGKSIAGQGRREVRDGDTLRLGAVNVTLKLVGSS